MDPLGAQGASQGDAPTYRRGVDVLHYDLSLSLPDTGNLIRGLATLTVRRTAPVDTLVLDLIALRVDGVAVNGTDVGMPGDTRDGATIRVPLPRGSGDTLRVAVRYGGPVTDGLIVRTDSMGRWTGFGDNWPDRARHWIPSVDHPSDKATVTWTVEAPSDRRVVANGSLVEETPLPRSGSPEAKPRTRTVWRESRPIPVYLMVIAAAPLAYYDLGPSACGRAELGGCVAQSVYVAPEVRDFLPGPFAEAGRIVELFSALVGPFPYEKLAHLQSATRFGGMENASAIFYSDAGFRRRTMGVGLIAHETAHQWFGDAVTEREWSHLWLSEGFATYFAALWTRHSAGDSAFRAEMARVRDQVVKSPVSASRPVIDTAQTNYLELLNTNSYQKGGLVLHMLRTQLGDSAFFRGVRAYYEKHRHATALSDDLRAELERASGTSLGAFFDQWLQRPGWPELTTAWRFDPRAGRVTLDIEQGTRWAPYTFPLTVEVRDAAGAVQRATVEVRAERRQQIAVPLALRAAPSAVTFDPDVSVLATFTSRARR